MKIDKAVYESAMRLRGAEFKPFVAWMEGARAATLEQLAVAPKGKKLQGKALALKEILDLLESAPAVLEKMEGPQAHL